MTGQSHSHYCGFALNGPSNYTTMLRCYTRDNLSFFNLSCSHEQLSVQWMVVLSEFHCMYISGVAKLRLGRRLDDQKGGEQAENSRPMIKNEQRDHFSLLWAFDFDDRDVSIFLISLLKTNMILKKTPNPKLKENPKSKPHAALRTIACGSLSFPENYIFVFSLYFYYKV